MANVKKAIFLEEGRNLCLPINRALHTKFRLQLHKKEHIALATNPDFLSLG